MTASPEKTILVCRCATHGLLARQELQTVLSSVEEQDSYTLEAIDDLCGMTVTDKVQLENLLAQEQVEIVACYPRAVKSMFEQADVEVDWAQTPIHNLRQQSGCEVNAALGVPSVPASEAPTSVASPEWRPWFPVLDLERCTHCRQCLSFCLFDVYRTDDDGCVTVENPQNCKDSCPACARVCPEVAIIFPKAADRPINGDEIQDELLEREKARITLEQSGGKNLYQVLSDRKKATRSLLKPSVRRKIQE
ncbi:hypothetical protein BVY04_03860 [bacterium M21]|nr:hypothetical protein BVY04_03860 [bacterium M21]